jgi:hypothetical protein
MLRAEDPAVCDRHEDGQGLSAAGQHIAQAAAIRPRQPCAARHMHNTIDRWTAWFRNICRAFTAPNQSKYKSDWPLIRNCARIRITAEAIA